jgi:predicted  nucleic acid-binding Zn-ribbon protein
VNLPGWADGAWADGSWVDGSWGTPAAPPVVVADTTRAHSGRRYRIIEDPDKLEEELKQERAEVKKDKKKLKILVRKLERDPIGLYALSTQVQAVETRIDERLEKIAQLAAMLTASLEAEIAEDDEEVLLLS